MRLHWNDFTFHSRSSGKQSRHLNDGCVEDVEDELRRDADGEHEQGDGNDDPFLAALEIGEGRCNFPRADR